MSVNEQQSDFWVEMDHQTFTWGRSGNRNRKTQHWVDRLWMIGLLSAALLLFGINLGSPPLLDWGEGAVALTAREIGKVSAQVWQWLDLKLSGNAYLEEPPLLHSIIAGAYKIAGLNEWATRLPGAILSSLSVPMLYGIGREIFPSRQSAIFSSLVYLTLLPVVCQGRLASVDGATLCFSVFLMWCMLRSRRDLRWSFGVGLGLGLIALSKGILIGFLLLTVAFVFLAWDTPRLLTSVYWWMGLLLGSAPGLSVYELWLFTHHQTFIPIGLIHPSPRYLWTLEKAPPSLLWYYLTQFSKFSVPWLLFWPYGFRLAWENRNWGWAKLVLVWAGVYSLAILLMVNKVPWYILPVYPTLALAAGAYLAEIWNGPSKQAYPRIWSIGLIGLAIVAIAASIGFSILPLADRSLSVIFASIALTMIIAAVLAARRDLQFILILFWGTYISLLLFMTSPYWIWELEAGYPVTEVAAILNRGTPANGTIYASFPSERPSLEFYSDRNVVPASASELKERWENDKQPYLLLDNKTFERLKLESTQAIGKASDWVLITKKTY